MNTIITYDIVGNKHRAKLRNFLKELGVRSQYSVYECRLDREEIKIIKQFCHKNLNLQEDSVRIYRVCSRCMNNAEIQGQGITFSQLDWIVI